MKTYNPNKTVSANSKGMIISYTDTCKHHSLTYSKILSSLQTNGNKFSNQSYQNIGTSVENKTQQKLYRVALYGLSVYTPEEITALSFVKKKEIITLQQKTQCLLNKFKQETMHLKLGSFLSTFFHKSTFAKALACYDNHLDDIERNTMSFKDLGITKEMIIELLQKEQLLPKNFYELK